MHTIIRDGNRVHLGISTGGHYLSEDGGDTFTASNQGVGAGFAPDPYPEFGQCVHKIARHEDAPGRLYMQNHGGWAEWTGPGGPRPDIGVLRSDDHGRSWRSIAKGLPSDFGFPIVVHPHDADTVYVMPLEGETRTCPGGAPAVWRSENGGDSWSRLARGLPKKQSYFTILRDAMDIDRLTAPALYFGTTTGQLWMYDPLSGAWFQLVNTGAGFVATAGTTIPEADVRLGDFDGDGSDDVLLYQPSTGDWSMGVTTASAYCCARTDRL
jgi:hypothetical protein